jgi:HPr kinase/phosphorylase
MKLKLVAHLEKPPRQRRATTSSACRCRSWPEDILGVTVRKVVIPVAPAATWPVLLEAAVRNYILQLRGKDSAAEFLARQKRAMQDDA